MEADLRVKTEHEVEPKDCTLCGTKMGTFRNAGYSAHSGGGLEFVKRCPACGTWWESSQG